jgi:uncharacterized protein (TIGR02145 family)
VLTATGTAIAAGTNIFTLNTTPNCNFSRTTNLTTGCYVKIDATNYKDFLCHNLGADTMLNPHTPVAGLQGAYIQWGKRGPNTTGDSRVDWQTAPNDGINGFVAPPTNGNSNTSPISGWSQNGASDYFWRTVGGTKTANDPCPTGYRLPTSTEWQSVINNNTYSKTGTFTSFNQYSSAIHFGSNGNTKLLTLPACGLSVSFGDGLVVNRGLFGYYWSSTENGSNSNCLTFNSTGVQSTYLGDRINAMSIRCIEE